MAGGPDVCVVLSGVRVVRAVAGGAVCDIATGADPDSGGDGAGGSDGRGVGFYFRNVTELVLFGVRGRKRTLSPGRTQVNVLPTRKREHSRKPDQMYDLIERCSPGPYLELFARFQRKGWDQWGNEELKPTGT